MGPVRGHSATARVLPRVAIGATRALELLAIAAVLSGCVTSTLIRTVPAGGRVLVNGQDVGETPVEFRVDESSWRPPYRYRIDLPGYYPAEGELATIPATGRITSAVFTLGIVAAVRPMSKFKDSYTITLKRDPSASPGAPGRDSTAIEKRLIELKRLFESGQLSRAEYTRAKEELLKEIQ